MTAADIMSRRPVTAGAATTVGQVLDLMKAHGISSVLILPVPGSTEYGIVTMRDVVAKVVTEDLDPDAVRVGEIMTWRLITAQPSWPVRRVAEVMATARVRRLPVMDGAKVVGLVSDTNVFTSLAPRHDWEHARQARKARALARASRTGPARTVGDLMSAPVLTIGAEARVQDAVEKMAAVGISSLLVGDVHAGGGIITKRDIVTKLVAAGRDPREVLVGEVMSTPVHTVDAGLALEECSSLMAAAGVRRFPVVRGGRIDGIISDSDILAAVAGHRWTGHRQHPTAVVAADIMRVPAADLQPVWTEALPPELSIWECAERLTRTGVRELPVVQEGRIIGIVGEAEILRALQERGGPD